MKLFESVRQQVQGCDANAGEAIETDDDDAVIYDGMRKLSTIKMTAALKRI